MIWSKMSRFRLKMVLGEPSVGPPRNDHPSDGHHHQHTSEEQLELKLLLPHASKKGLFEKEAFVFLNIVNFRIRAGLPIRTRTACPAALFDLCSSSSSGRSTISADTSSEELLHLMKLLH